MMQQASPNILFLMTDQQRHDAMGCVQPIVKTPNLDALANDGIRFAHAYCANPSCVPSRASIITGKLPSQCGAPSYITYLLDNQTTFPRLLQQAGYHTAVVGKQHFGQTNIVRGYDDERIMDHHEPAPDFANGQPDDIYHSHLREQGVTAAAQLSKPVDAPWTRQWTGDPELHIDAFIGQQGIQWVRERRPTDRPWYCCISFPGPHTPYDGLGLPEADWYDESSLPLPESSHEDWSSKPPHWSQFSLYRDHPEWQQQLADPARREAAIRKMRRAYWANMSLIDRQVGNILDALKRSGAYDNTLVVFSSDHGDFQGEFSLPAKAQYLAEALMRVPLIIKPPHQQQAGRVVDDSFASTVDIAPTVLSAAGADVPDEMCGTDLTGWWRQPNDPPIQRQVLMEAQQMRALRYDRWKIVYYRGRSYGELYDLQADPAERLNLWDDPACAQVRLELHRRLMDQMIAATPRSDRPWNVSDPVV